MNSIDGRLRALAELIAASPHNLVARGEREPEHLVEYHLQEAAQVGRLLPCEPGDRWVDLGTGGGIPGLVLAHLYPRTTWILMDSVAKKSRAVEGFARELDLPNVEVMTGRAEELAHRPNLREGCAGVVARAVARLVVLLELARGFVEPGGALVAIKGSAWEQELQEARWALRRLGWGQINAAAVPQTKRSTWLITARAEGVLPAWVPRGVGVPRHRPLWSPGPDRG